MIEHSHWLARESVDPCRFADERAFMLEHEIARKQQLIDFVGDTSLLLRRHCRRIEPCTDVLLWRPCLRAILSKIIWPLLKRDSIYERIKKSTK
jgi:hypothetical protein